MSQMSTSARNGQYGGIAGAAAARRRAGRRIASGIMVVPQLKPSAVPIIGPFVGDDVPPRDACKWIEGDSPGQYCGQPGEAGWCPHHAARVKPPLKSNQVHST